MLKDLIKLRTISTGEINQRIRIIIPIIIVNVTKKIPITIMKLLKIAPIILDIILKNPILNTELISNLLGFSHSAFFQGEKKVLIKLETEK